MIDDVKEVPDRSRGQTIGVLIGGILLIQVLFAFSYVGGLHNPEAENLPLAVAGPSGAVDLLVEQTGSGTGDAVDLEVEEDAAAARDAIDDRRAFGALIIDEADPTDVTLLVSEAPSPTTAVTLVDEIEAVADELGIPVSTEVVNPVREGDPRGLSPFYVAVAWVVGGYLLATALNVFVGRPVGRRATLRMLGLHAVYSLVAGLGTALVVGPLLDVLDTHFLGLWLLGSAVTFTVLVTTLAFVTILGTALGTGLTILLFVVVGNPASGGAFPRELLPGFWRAVGAFLPPGIAVDGINGMLYFSTGTLVAPLLLLAAYLVAALAVVFAFADRDEPLVPLKLLQT